MKKRILSITVLLLIVLVSNVFASTIDSTNCNFEVVEDNVCNIKITDSSSFEKKIIDYNKENREITIRLTVKNNASTPLDDPCEIVLLIDNSDSMSNTISSGGTRMQAVISSAKKFTEELFKSDTIKVSVVSFSSANGLNARYTDPDWIEEGTEADAKLLTALTDSKNAVNAAIDSLGTNSLGARTDIEAGISLAKKQFSGTIDNKFIILLTDGVPNLSLGRSAAAYSQADITNTKNALVALKQSGIKIFSMMTEQSTGNPNPENPSETLGSYADIATAVFGTPANPTAGKYYYVADNKIEETISQTILADLKAADTEILRDVDIYDYFPQSIVNNFDFSIVDKPNKGTVSESINLQDNSIKWHIDELSYGETATMSYKLKLKNNIEQTILNVILNTNEKVDITTSNVLNPDGSKKLITGDETPKVRVINIEGVIIKYLEKGTNKELLPSETIKGDIGDPYKTQRKPISGYEAADPEPTNKEGKITQDPITVIYYYNKIPTVIPKAGISPILTIILSVLVLATSAFGGRLYLLNRKTK